MGLRIVGTEDIHSMPCPACGGLGKKKHEDWQRRDGRWVRGGGFMPCERCMGSKRVMAGPPEVRGSFGGGERFGGGTPDGD